MRGPLNNLSLSIELLAGSPVVQAHPDIRELVRACGSGGQGRPSGRLTPSLLPPLQVTLMGQSTGTVRVITDDVLFIAKVESGEFNLVFSPLEVGQVVGSAVQQLGNVASARGVLVTSEIDAGVPPLLLGVANRLRQVLMNLLGNGA